MAFINGFFSFLFFISFILLIVGLIAPKKVSQLFNKDWGRKMIAKTIGLVSLASLVIAVATTPVAPVSPKTTDTVKATEQVQEINTEKPQEAVPEEVKEVAKDPIVSEATLETSPQTPQKTTNSSPTQTTTTPTPAASSPAPTSASQPTSTPAPAQLAPPPAPVPSGHTFYTSSHYSAKLYYCDTDEGWKSLSPSYLKSFPSAEALLKVYPRTLHEPCK